MFAFANKRILYRSNLSRDGHYNQNTRPSVNIEK